MASRGSGLILKKHSCPIKYYCIFRSPFQKICQQKNNEEKLKCSYTTHHNILSVKNKLIQNILSDRYWCRTKPCHTNTALKFKCTPVAVYYIIQMFYLAPKTASDYQKNDG